MKIINKAVTLVAAALAFFVMSGQAYAKKLTMNIGYSVNEAHPYGTFMNLFAERFQTLSGGTVRVKVHCCHKMGSEQETFSIVTMKPFTLLYISSFALTFSHSLEHSKHKRSGNISNCT